jgi:FAD/FMN-containing dehydrogenase
MVDKKVTTSKGTSLDEKAVQEFKANLRGELIRPEDSGYDAARKVWNGMIDKHPALIVLCTGVADVISAVNFARTNKLLVAVRGGGHGVAGNAVCDGGIVIDLSRMKGMRVDPTARTARAQTGLTWGEFDRETQAFGLAITGGLVSTTGIAGFTLGGGLGWLMRKHGLTCDNLLSADIVTADGRFLTASKTENADLFWGVRGGGGNFGIATSFEYRLHPVGKVIGGLSLYPAEKAREVLHFYREYLTTVPENLTSIVFFLKAPPAPFIPENLHGAPVVGFAVCYAGSIEEGERVVRPLKEFGPPAVDLINPMPYTALQSMLDAGAPPGLQNYWKSEYLKGLSDDAIDTIVDHSARMQSPLSQVHVQHMQGAVSCVGADETPFGNRDAAYVLNIVGMWSDPKESETHTRWTREFFATMESFSTGGVYVNFLGNEGEKRVTAAYGQANYERLVALKNKYDPTNFFSLNQNIKPGKR